MIRIKIFDLNIGILVERYFIMLVGTLILGFFTNILLTTIWAFTIAGSAILGISIHVGKEKEEEKQESKVVRMDKRKDLKHVG